MCEHGYTLDEVNLGICQACNSELMQAFNAIDMLVAETFNMTIANCEQFDVYVTDVPSSLTVTIADKAHNFVLVERGAI